ncbi:hypothetical protein JT358_03440 [Micrococcales bacterium 31B]|nr:hypothetical protein [Micrococcales bacterium 31B]
MKRRNFLTVAGLAATAPALGLATPAGATVRGASATYVAEYRWDSMMFEVDEAAGTSTYLTRYRFKELGYPTPQVKDWLPGTRVFQFKGLDTLYAQLFPLVHALTFDEWRAMNFVKPIVVTPDVVKYPWQDDVYAVYFPSTDKNSWIWQHLTLQQWTALGQPKPRDAGWIDGTEVRRVPSRNNIVYSTLNGVHHELTFAQWGAMGDAYLSALNYNPIAVSYPSRYTRMSDLYRDYGFVLDVTYGTFTTRNEGTDDSFTKSIYTARVLRVVNGQNIPLTVSVRLNGGIWGGTFTEIGTELLPREGSREIIFCTYDTARREFTPHWQGRFAVVNGQLQVPQGMTADLKVL